jgi:hypothetical protein
LKYGKMGAMFEGKVLEPQHPLYGLLNAYRALKVTMDGRGLRTALTTLNSRIDFLSDIDGSGSIGDDIEREAKGVVHKYIEIKQKGLI